MFESLKRKIKSQPDNEIPVERNAAIIKQTLAEFSIDCKIKSIQQFPRFTRYCVILPSSTIGNKVMQLDSNLALNLDAPSVRIAQSVNTNQIDIEVPNDKSIKVDLNELTPKATHPLEFVAGVETNKDAFTIDIAKIQNIMIAGQTGSGKTTMLNSILLSLLHKNTPTELQVILIDPKQLEFASYRNLPHLQRPVIIKPEEWMEAMTWIEQEVTRRQSLLKNNNFKDLDDYNAQAREPLPRILVICDEFSDMMMHRGDEVERIMTAISRGAASVGVHIIISTSRPSTDVYTAAIQEACTTRMTFTVASKIDSQTILGNEGAEKLLGLGDFLLKMPGAPNAIRLQAAYISEANLQQVTGDLHSQL